jgi:hypothetical protein
MKHKRFFRILAAAVILALLMLAIPLTPVLAQTLTLTVTTGSPGTAITVTGGAGFPAEGSGYVWFDINGNYLRDSGEPYLAASVSGGVLSAPGNITVPTVTRGTYYVRVKVPYDTDANDDAHVAFAVTSGISINTSSGNVGDTLTVEGDGFDASDTITIWYDTTNVGTRTTDTYGSFTSDFTFVVPASTKGPHDIKGDDDGVYSNTVTFTVSPEITLNPALGTVDDEVVVTGTGFDDYSDITLYFDNVAQDIADGDDNTNSKGSFECTFYVPEAARGNHTVKVQDQALNYDTATFTVSASITLDPTSGPSGTTVTVTGTGFRSSHAITVTYNDVDITADISGDDATDADGSFEFTFDVPAGDAGTYEVEVSDGTNTTAADFESTTSATISETTTNSDPGYVAMELTITGVGFAAEDTVTVRYSPDNEVLTTAATNADGNFSAIFTIPASVGGEHIITVSDGTVSKSFDFFMEENPPPVPALISPLAGEKADALAVFDWETVSDVAPASPPVTYDLQVATSQNFSLASILVEEIGLATSDYTLPELDKLESTGEDAPYYWRVRAVDAASNASAWSEPETFTVGWSFEFSGWVVYVTMAVIAVVFLFLGLWIGRRTGGGGDYF